MDLLKVRATWAAFGSLVGGLVMFLAMAIAEKC